MSLIPLPCLIACSHFFISSLFISSLLFVCLFTLSQLSAFSIHLSSLHLYLIYFFVFICVYLLSQLSLMSLVSLLWLIKLSWHTWLAGSGGRCDNWADSDSCWWSGVAARLLGSCMRRATSNCLGDLSANWTPALIVVCFGCWWIDYWLICWLIDFWQFLFSRVLGSLISCSFCFTGVDFDSISFADWLISGSSCFVDLLFNWFLAAFVYLICCFIDSWRLFNFSHSYSLDSSLFVCLDELLFNRFLTFTLTR